jgi:hypothetical protein
MFCRSIAFRFIAQFFRHCFFEDVMEKVSILLPKMGFYHHYKHDHTKGVDHYAYEVLGIGLHTESNCRPEDVYMVMYRPLYEHAHVYRTSLLLGVACFDSGPLEMWMSKVKKDGLHVPRFTLITDKIQNTNLTLVRNRMYG